MVIKRFMDSCGFWGLFLLDRNWLFLLVTNLAIFAEL